MGESRRYDRDRPIDRETDAEVRALRIIAELIAGRTPVITDRDVAIRVGALLRAAATELAAGRALPLPVRRAVRHLADALRAALDPRTTDPVSTGGESARARRDEHRE